MHPVDIFKKSENSLAIKWDDGTESIFAMDFLRKKCPCATCKAAKENSSANPLRILADTEIIQDNVKIREAEIVGRYAIKFSWSDGHNEGIYSFDYLKQLTSLSPAD